MRMKWLYLIFFLTLAALTVMPGCVSAQGVDVDSMSEEELLDLMATVQARLDHEEETPVPEDPTAAPIPTMTPLPERIQYTIYKNKKLTVEALPGYMFVPKPSEETEEEPEPGTPPQKKDTRPDPPDINPCDPNFPDVGWCWFNDAWHCGCG